MSAAAVARNYAPLIYGSAAIGHKPDHNENSIATHRWTFYVRSAEIGKDLDLIIAKVVFRLHPTCTQPLVECTKAPYETTQLGWGEFPCTIEVHFKNESVATFVHQLRLHATGVPTNKAIVSEQYDEVVFHPQSSAPFITGALRAYGESSNVQALGNHAAFASHWKTFNEANDLALIAKAHAYIKQELEAAVAEYELVEAEYLKNVPQPMAHPAVVAAAAKAPQPQPQQSAAYAFLDDAPPRVYAMPVPSQQQLLHHQMQQQQHMLHQQPQQQQNRAAGQIKKEPGTGSSGGAGAQPAKKKGRPTLQDNKTKPATGGGGGSKKQQQAGAAPAAGGAAPPPQQQAAKKPAKSAAATATAAQAKPPPQAKTPPVPAPTPQAQAAPVAQQAPPPPPHPATTTTAPAPAPPPQ